MTSGLSFITSKLGSSGPQPFGLFCMYWFQVYNLVVKQSHTLHGIPLNISSTPMGTVHSYHNITDYISYALLISL